MAFGSVQGATGVGRSTGARGRRWQLGGRHRVRCGASRCASRSSRCAVGAGFGHGTCAAYRPMPCSPGVLQPGDESLSPAEPRDLIAAAVGDVREFGLPRPDPAAHTGHPTTSDDLLEYLSRGWIQPQGRGRRGSAERSPVPDGTTEQVDLIIACHRVRRAAAVPRPGVVCESRQPRSVHEHLQPNPRRPGPAGPGRSSAGQRFRGSTIRPAP